SRQLSVVMGGLPGSGKSTYLKELRANAISSDEIRLLLADDATIQTIHPRVFATMRYLLRHRIAIGRPVSYMDATHLTVAERAPFFASGGGFGVDLERVFFAVPVQVCRERIRRPGRFVPEEATGPVRSRWVRPGGE